MSEKSNTKITLKKQGDYIIEVLQDV